LWTALERQARYCTTSLVASVLPLPDSPLITIACWCGESRRD
jgi:hypothetical protein